MKIRIIIGFLVIGFIWTTVPIAQYMPIPVELQFPLFLKILTFDRNLKSRAGEEIVIGVVYQRKLKSSLKTKDEFIYEMDNSSVKKIQNIPIKVISIDIDTESLRYVMERENVDALYLAQLRAVDIGDIVNLSRKKQIVTLTGIPDYVKAGVAVGVDIKEEQPQILINLPASRAEGVDFSSQLLKLAKVIGK